MKLKERMVSLDAFRGFIMVMLAASGFGIAGMVRQPEEHPVRWQVLDQPRWEWFAHHFEHPPWQSSFVPGSHDAQVGSPWLHWAVSFWDLIQPAFMFMVGVAMPLSYRSRKERGDPQWKMGLHAATRAAVLVLLGVFLYSLHNGRTNWIFPNVLAQIGLGYLFAYLLLLTPRWAQITAFFAILAATWTMFAVYNVPESYDPAAVNASAERGEVYAGFFRHWSKNGNVAAAFDTWLLPLFPPTKDTEGNIVPFSLNRGGYMTLNFLPSIATTLLGIFCGQLLMSDRTVTRKLLLLLALGAGCLAGGVLAGATCCPIVKRIWTPSWVLFSGGYVVWMLALFYLLFDVLPLKKLAFPLTVIGMNSLAIYLMGEMLRGWLINHVVQTHFGELLRAALGQITIWTGWMQRMGATPETVGDITYQIYQPMVDTTSALIVMWLLAYYMYRNRIFIRM